MEILRTGRQLVAVAESKVVGHNIGARVLFSTAQFQCRDFGTLCP